MTPSRRTFIGSAGLIGVAAAVPAVAAPRLSAPRPAGEDSDAELQATVTRYLAFGDKASGGPGDTACAYWLEETLTEAGYRCRHQTYEVPFFEAKQTTLTVGTARANLIPQAPVAVTGPRGLTAPLRLAERDGDLSGTIALVTLPYKRWVALAEPQVALPLADALRRGAAGVVLVTTGPTGEAIALNVSLRGPAIAKPVAILAPKDAGVFAAAAARGESATLTLDGAGGAAARRPAFNLIARLDRGAAQTIIISTPRSGWFGCAAERGSGLAVWLSLARWLARENHGVNVELLATSAHEYNFFGGEKYLTEAAPPPAATKLWVHIGASAVARDWHELGSELLPLPSADSQRVLTATADLLDRARAEFRGINGLEATYLADKKMAGGELVNVLTAGYRSAFGLYGIHRYFHTREDDMRCMSDGLMQPVASAFRRTIDEALT